MAGGVERGHIETCDGLIKEVNRLITRFTTRTYRINPKKYEALIKKKSLTIETKKKRLLKALSETILHTLSLDHHKLGSTKDIIDDLRLNVRIVRALIFKLKDVNYYLENVFLHELGLKAKQKSWTEKVAKDVKAIKGKTGLGKEDIARLEHTIHRMISRVITLDERLLKAYKKRELRIVRDEHVGVKDLDKILRKETELLMHLEAKFPPPNKVTAQLLVKESFNHWIIMILTALSSLEHNFKKDMVIFTKLKQSEKIRKKIALRIDDLIREKLELMQIKEQRVLSWEHVGKINEALHDAAHQYLAASQL